MFRKHVQKSSCHVLVLQESWLSKYYKLLQISLSLWNLAEVAATYMAPVYRQLCDSGELETLDELLADMVRLASVRFSQQGGDQFQ